MKRTLFAICLMLLPGTTKANDPVPQSRAERTNYVETSRYEDVMDFIGALQQRGDNLKVESFGTSGEGRALPLVILANPAVSSPSEAHLSGKPIVFLMANIHAGEVEGKEAVQHLMRDIVTGTEAGLLDKIILLIAPIYNADGNEKIDIKNRTAQNGPTGGVGTRENSQRLDLNRDFIKLKSSEARGLIDGVFNRWDPHVMMDLHTTNGSYHGYALTYSPPLHPNTDKRITSYLRDKLFPDVSKTMLSKYKYHSYYYGNFVEENDPTREFYGNQPANPKAWATYDYRPRFGTNYVGLRNRIAILSEAYSYLDFRKRVDVTDKFVRAILHYIAARPDEVVTIIRDADRQAMTTGLTGGNEQGYGTAFKLKASPKPMDILVGSVTQEVDPRTGKPRLKATDEARPVKMLDYSEFQITERLMPPAAYLLKPDQTEIVKMLQLHGVVVEQFRRDEAIEVEQFIIEKMNRAERPFQGQNEVKLQGKLETARVQFPRGSYMVSVRQPAAPLIFDLLEGATDDGLVTWNYLDQALNGASSPEARTVFPVFRVKQMPRVSTEIVKR